MRALYWLYTIIVAFVIAYITKTSTSTYSYRRSHFHPGPRGPNWLKIALNER